MADNVNSNVKVLVKGSEREYHVDCKNCDSRLSYMKTDVQEEFIEFTEREKDLRQNRGREGKTTKYIICPECGERVILRK